ncbi:hypothetical protein [uncultured Dysosmobacter sp.]|nr:hypothetical protein [uncultured Dysosmobacter sp.]
MERRSLTCFLIFTVPVALVRLGIGCMSVARLWRCVEWTTSWF